MPTLPDKTHAQSKMLLPKNYQIAVTLTVPICCQQEMAMPLIISACKTDENIELNCHSKEMKTQG